MNVDNTTKNKEAGVLFTVGFFLVFLGPLAGSVHFWSVRGPVVSPAGSYNAIIGVLFILGSLCLCRFRVPRFSPGAVAVMLAALLVSDWITHDYSLLPGPEIRGEILVGFAAALLLMRLGRLERSFSYLAAGGCLLLFWCFFDAADGRFIFSDDHSVVVYRLELLRRHFPFIPFYNPLWNAGLDARDFFATGVLNIFLPFAPVIYLFGVEPSYNLIIATVLFGVVPLSAYAAARLDEQDVPTASIAAIIAVSSSLLWYRWGLKYGSMGFVTATALIPFNFTAAKRLLTGEPLRRRHVAAFIATFTLMLFWSLSFAVFLPFAAFALGNARSLMRSSRIRKTAVSLLALNLPWIILFLSVSKVGNFISIKEEVPRAEIAGDSDAPVKKNNLVKGTDTAVAPESILKTLREHAAPANPLLLLCALPGMLVFGSKTTRLFFIVETAWLLGLGLLAAPLKPQLELDRMLIILGVLCSLPAAVFIRRTVSRAGSSIAARAGSALYFSVLAASVLSAGSIMYNRSPEKYSHADDVYTDLAADIKAAAGSGRAVFLGFVLHELNSGHLAPLIIHGEKPLVASTLFHNLWYYTNLIPKEYMRDGEAGIERYLDLMNTSLVIAHERSWREYCFSRPDRYEFISRRGVFNLFRRRNFPDSYFLEGAGSVVEQTSSSVRFVPRTADGVLKFAYFPFLQAPGCSLSPHRLPGDIVFTRITNCPVGQEISLTAKTGFRRLFSK